MDTDTLPAAPRGALALIQNAIDQKVDPATLRELLAVKKDWEADEARKAFYSATSEFQRRAPIIPKADDANGKPYARMDRIWREIKPLVTDLGLSVTWQKTFLQGVDDAPICHIEGRLSHKDGHGQDLVFDVPVPEAITNRDGKAVQNAAQRMGSAHTYAQRYGTCAALGIVCGDDDDGNGGVVTIIDAKEKKELLDLLDAARGIATFNEDAFWRFASVKNKDLGLLTMERFADVRHLLWVKLGKAKP
jgi:hypothetical protein